MASWGRAELRDPCSQLRSATRRAKSDVANKLVSMFLHELSRRVSQAWPIRVDGEEYEKLVRERFGSRCPYCVCDLASTVSVIEHLDGMNRYRGVSTSREMCWLPVDGVMARSEGTIRAGSYRVGCWDGRPFYPTMERVAAPASHAATGRMSGRMRRSERLASRRTWKGSFLPRSLPELERASQNLARALPQLLAKLYADCQVFAETEINSF